MPTIDQLNSASSFDINDLIAIFSAANGNTRKASLGNFITFLQQQQLPLGAGVQGALSTGVGANGSFVVFDQALGTPTGGDVSATTVLSTGAIAQRSLANRFADVANVKDFGAIGNGVTDDSAAIQAAINTGALAIVFPPATYKANNLVCNTNSQRFLALGNVKIQKNANGPIVSGSGSLLEFNGIAFQGDASTPVFTGDNIYLTGDHPRFINCGSRWAYGRALKATGNHVQIFGTCDIYQTADATATGYDIEIGVSGTATLYHALSGIYTSQQTGGIKLIDTGSAELSGGQIGKLYIAAGTSPAGTNGGSTMGMRIVGTTVVEVPSASFACCTCADNVTFTAATSSCAFGDTNIVTAGKTVTNLGTQNLIVNGRNDGLYTISGQKTTFENNIPVVFRNSTNGAGAGSALQIEQDSSDNFSITNFVSGKRIRLEQAGPGTMDFVSNGVDVLAFSSAGIPSGASVAVGNTANTLVLRDASGNISTASFNSSFLSWFNSLPTILPGSAGIAWNNGGTIAVS